MRARDGATIFDFGQWHSAVASRRNDDGTISFISIDPTVHGFDFVVGERDGKKTLIIRDAQHEYGQFVEATASVIGGPERSGSAGGAGRRRDITA